MRTLASNRFKQRGAERQFPRLGTSFLADSRATAHFSLQTEFVQWEPSGLQLRIVKDFIMLKCSKIVKSKKLKS